MTYLEVSPHLNKLVKVNLKNKKRKVGWLVYNYQRQIPHAPFEEVLCLGVHHGRKLCEGEKGVVLQFQPPAEKMHIGDIQCIRSCM